MMMNKNERADVGYYYVPTLVSFQFEMLVNTWRHSWRPSSIL